MSKNQLGDEFEQLIRKSLRSNLDENNDEFDDVYFSYIGNDAQPPDLIIRDGDALEIKIKEGFGQLQTNSSWPRDRLLQSDPKLNESCRKCEKNWLEKELFYVIGNRKKADPILKNIIFVHARCMFDCTEKYIDLYKSIQDAVNSLNFPFTASDEIARLNEIDILGRAGLRVRGMFIMDHPMKIFEEIFNKEIRITALMTKKHFQTLVNEENKDIFYNSPIKVRGVQIPSPSDTLEEIECVLLESD